jgi:ribosomal protein S15P/S13E
MRDQAIESVWLTVESHVREQRGRDEECRRQLLSLEERIRRLECGRDE